MTRLQITATIAAALLLSSCGGDQDPAPVEFKAATPADPAPQPAAPVAVAAAPDSRGVINFPDYAVIQASAGDTLDSMAARVGLSPGELASYNGLTVDYRPRVGDELVLPPRPGGYGQVGPVAGVAASGPISGPVSAPAATNVASGPLSAPATEPDATEIAASETPPSDTGWSPEAIGSAIERAGSEPAAAPTAPAEADLPPIGSVVIANPQPGTFTHTVQPGETTADLARRYEVRVSQIAAWNGLIPPDYAVAPGMVLTIPGERPTQTAVFTAPGVDLGTPPSSAEPLPADTAPAPELPSPDLARYQTEETTEPPAEVRPAPAPAAAPAEPEAVAALAQANRGRLLRPVTGAIVKPYSKESGANRNDGVDFDADAGAPVLAAEDGTVALISNSLGGLGNIVLLRHSNNLLTVYGRMGQIEVRKGERVRRGQVIGTVATAQPPKTPTLHFEVRRGAVSVDPGEYL